MKESIKKNIERFIPNTIDFFLGISVVGQFYLFFYFGNNPEIFQEGDRIYIIGLSALSFIYLARALLKQENKE